MRSCRTSSDVSPEEQSAATVRTADRPAAEDDGQSASQRRSPQADQVLQVTLQRSAQTRLTPEQALIAAEIVTFLGIRPHVQFTPHVVATWCRVLSLFPIEIVRDAMLETALSQEQYVGLPQIFHRCRQLEARDTYTPHRHEDRLPARILHRVFQALGLDNRFRHRDTLPSYVVARENGQQRRESP